MKKFLALAVLALSFAASAQTAQSLSDTRAETGAIQNVGSPTINFPGNPGVTSGVMQNDVRTNQAAQAATVFINPPAADTCARAGAAISFQAVGAGGAISTGTGSSDTCEARADAINLKVTGAPQAVVKARHCLSPLLAQAYANAGDPCPKASKVAEAPTNEQAVVVSKSADPYMAMRGYANK